MRNSPIFDPSECHASRIIAHARVLMSQGYRLKKYSDEPGLPFDQNALTSFQETGRLPEGVQLFGMNRIDWLLDARPPTSNDAAPDTPWYYDQSSVRGVWSEPFSPKIIARMNAEWDNTRESLGEPVHGAGRKLLRISGIILSSPEKYRSLPYVDLRSDENCTFAEFLAFGGDYWLHLFVTQWRSPEPETIVALCFTPYVPDLHAQPPLESENLVVIDTFSEALE